MIAESREPRAESQREPAPRSGPPPSALRGPLPSGSPPSALGPPSRSGAAIHWIFLAMAALALALALVLEAPGGEAVVVPLVERPLPGLCTFKRISGAPCPGCGLTRCFISLAHGDLAAAWRYNPAGILLFAAAAFQIPFRFLQLRRLRRGLPEWRWRPLDWCLWLIVGALIVQWIVRMVSPSWL